MASFGLTPLTFWQRCEVSECDIFLDLYSEINVQCYRDRAHGNNVEKHPISMRHNSETWVNYQNNVL